MSITPDRIKELRDAAGLRQEDLAFLLGVGIASIPRWEKSGGTLPGGMTRQLLEVIGELHDAGFDLSVVGPTLRHAGNMGALRLLLNAYHDLKKGAS